MAGMCVCPDGYKQSELVAALEPGVDRLHRHYKAAQEALKAATEQKNAKAEQAAKGELDALPLFQRDMGTNVRLYTYLSQIFDYGTTDIEKPAIFFKHLLRLLDFGREREGVDLSRLVLTHRTMRNQGKRAMVLSEGENPKLEPLAEAGGGSLHEKEKSLLREIVQRVNELFEGNLTDDDKRVFVINVIKGKMLESAKLRQQAANDTRQQFAGAAKRAARSGCAGVGLVGAGVCTVAIGSRSAFDGRDIDKVQIRDPTSRSSSGSRIARSGFVESGVVGDEFLSRTLYGFH